MRLRVAFYYVGDLRIAAKNYSAFLEASPISADEDWVRFHLEGGDLALHLDSSLPETQTNAPIQYGAVVSLSVADIEHSLQLARASGFRQVGEIQALPYGKQAQLRDSWGNRLSLVQPAQGYQ